MNTTLRTHRILVAGSLIFIFGLLLACGSGVATTSAPRWACPSPTPKPFGEDGPIKREYKCRCKPDPIDPTKEKCDTCYDYYEKWEQEYGHLPGPPFPSPTPYGMQGTSFKLGQRVEIGPVHVMVEASDGPVVEYPGIAPNTQQIYYIDITWYNHSAETLPISYGNDVRVRAVTAPGGAIVTDSNWGMSDRALDVSGREPPANAIPPGESKVQVPVIAPIGNVKTVEIVFVGSTYSPVMPTATTLPGTPTATPIVSTPTPTPTPNSDLRDTAPTYLTVQWTEAEIGIGPSCDDPGAMTPWDGKGWGPDVPIAIAAPPGASRVVQLALNQTGKRYVWGAKGPEVFDCSGLMTWSYAQINIRIPQGTAGQWPGMRSVSASEIQPGDLIFFAVASAGRIDHVGMLVGDVNGDGKWDMVHASAPCCGVRVEYDVFGRPFWSPKIAGFRTAR